MKFRISNLVFRISSDAGRPTTINDQRSTSLGKFWRLTRSEQWILIKAAVLLPTVAVALRLFPYGKVKAMLGRPSPIGRSGEPTFELAEQISYLVRVAANRGMYRANCLPQSVVTWALLRRRGIDGTIRFGARNGEDGFQAHAWVDFRGRELGTLSEGYVELRRRASAPAAQFEIRN